MSDANAEAARVRSEAERDLAALIDQRDLIDRQVTNVRKKLTTLTDEATERARALDESSPVPVQQMMPSPPDSAAGTGASEQTARWWRRK
ncbi:MULTISPECIES: hypothetical protein [unclassified Kitasatospora]|uniref:hypothetical protein n=1 Tax=unclassified Kitasatospora TaxID=2633591 RepID=UPI00070DC841|nr:MULTISPECIES: hypothetical protein [unclassified Kitasatospora]KQV11914.1 hypothetical protein ASC99_35655 [Kitasatospora sp. Root107]KRB68887.1 hypothetical protein ASE03_28725 [Kitasatospora sp. Root187]